MRDEYNVRNIAASYKFDESYEMNIYKYLCCRKMKKKIKEKMDNDIKFITYHQWENYIQNKYKNLNKYELKEFGHFLNLKSRNLKPEYEYWRIVIPILFTIISEKVFDALINIGIIKISSILQFIVQLVIIIGVGTISARVIALIAKNIWDVSDKSNFYYDYKEIINNIIEAFDEENYHKKG